MGCAIERFHPTAPRSCRACTIQPRRIRLIRCQWLNISGIFYSIIICLVKESILVQYLRIFVPNRRADMGLFMTIHGLIWIVFLFYLVVTVFQIAMCSPRERIWNKLITEGHCFNEDVAFRTIGVFNVISDLAVLIVPMVPIWKLQLPLKRKMLIIGIFATGFA